MTPQSTYHQSSEQNLSHITTRDWLQHWAIETPTAIAIREVRDDGETGRVLTYEELNAWATAATVWLQARGCKKGHRIALLAENTPEHFMLFGAAQKTGCILVPLNYRLTADEIAYLLEDSTPSVVIVEEKYAALLATTSSTIAHIISLPDAIAEWKQLININAEQLETPIIPDVVISDTDALFILYTSGTTGFPKGALYTHGMAYWNSVNTALRLDLTSNDHTIVCTPLFHTGGLNVLATPLLHIGGSFSLMKKFDANAVLTLLASTHATIFMGVPTMLQMMKQSERFDHENLDAVRYFIVGGEALPLPVIEAWQGRGIPIRQGFGMTEAGPNLFSLHHDDSVRKIGSIGTPNKYVEVRIVNDDGNDVSTGERGELLLVGPIVTTGYWNKPDATREAFFDGWFRTGDVVIRDAEGFFYVVDRKKNMFISGGENVYPVEVERVLVQHPCIAEAVVVGVPDVEWGEVGKAFVVLREGVTLTAGEVQAFCREKLAKYKIPKHVEFVRELPKNDTGKINRRALQS